MSMSALEVGVLVLAGALCVALFVAASRRQSDEAKPEDSDAPSIRVVEVSLMPGAVMEQWCDGCNRTHRFVTVYAYEGNDPSTARRIGIAPVPDDEDQDGGPDA